MSEQQIEVGQIWRRKRTGRHIRIVREVRGDDWRWEGHDYRARGASYGCYIRRDYELIEQPADN
ncbi:hypothetical protein [Cellulomonas denverensis]|uniref:Uncharacterized protein n=1 Tax=Cellulomonas denverensis TaxID=264297 RepID=A0A7X6KUS4_9CELL|nr:hypothetical protein [Cellulomonas denverensis]NKY22190.1 hypothetical protein [Cellulomonas denverensis]GIG27153.1 hypothetical protein Cde04nite_33970 [Cellulomonas denverensis]